MDRTKASYVVLALLVAASLCVTVWIVGARHELHQVEVVWAGAPDCTGATVRPHQDEHGVRDGGWVIGARPGMRCRIEIEVTNRSGRDVRLDEVVAHRLGSAEGDFPVAATGDPADDPGPDAAYPVDRVVRDGRTVTVPVRLGFRDGSCAPSTTFGLSAWPQVSLSVWQRRELVSAADTFYVYDATDGASCDS